MLARVHRISEAVDIRRLGRGGKRLDSKFFVVRVHRGNGSLPSRFVFIVSKQVGGAVTRNKVKRRLRSLAQEELAGHPVGWDVVVRALPPAASASYQEIATSWQVAFSKAPPE